ncbi:hypothetical protein Tco_0143978 [Tanacetum coccineum]
MRFDDLYNNFKIVEQEVKRTATSSTSSSSQNMAFVSSPSSINEVNTANVQVSTANSSVSIDSILDSTANLSDATVYAFLANQPNGSQLVHEDLEKIHEDDLKEMDLKWQLALLSMRVRRECRSLRNQEIRLRNHDNGNINQDSSRRTVNVEETSSKAMVAINGAGFDWSFMAEEEVTTNMALMDFSDSEVYNDKTCSNTCLKSFETLKTQLDNLRVEFNKSEFNLATYKRGDASFKDSEIIALKSEIEKLKKEKECNQIKIDKFENASNCLDKLIGSQISDNSRKGVGYNVVPPLPTGLFAPPTIDLSNSVNTAKINSINTAKGNRVTNAVGEHRINAVKSSACWEDSSLELKVLVVHHTTNGHQFTMSNRQERIGYSRANDNWFVLLQNPTIYVSLIEQFWQTVTVDTVNDGEQQLTVTVDGQTIAITEDF